MLTADAQAGAPADSLRVDKPAARPLHVVVGPKTRLGTELLDQIDASGGSAVAVARDQRDLEALAGRDNVVVATSDDATLRAALNADAIRIHVCALGPVHPEQAENAEPLAVEQELATLERLLRCTTGRDIHIVLISTVIALAPVPDRRHYAGWKGLVERRLWELVNRNPRASLSVLYPGRLVSARDPRRPWGLGYTTYRRLAGLSLAAAAGSCRARIVGGDARVWLLVRAAVLAMTSITGRTGKGRADRTSI